MNVQTDGESFQLYFITSSAPQGSSRDVSKQDDSVLILELQCSADP